MEKYSQKQALGRVIKIRNKVLDLTRPNIMGILNLTPDSFSDGGLLLKEESLQQQAAYLVQSGAEILDIGAESTRPGAVRVSEEVEYKNLKWALQIIDDLNIQFFHNRHQLIKECI